MAFLTRCLIRSFCTARFIQNNERLSLRSRTAFESVMNSDINLMKLLPSKKPLTEQDWKQAREELFQYNYINEKNIDAAIANICTSLNPSAFASYVQFLKSKNYEINLYIAGRYISMFEMKQSRLTDSETKEIYDMYDYVRKKYPVLDEESCVTFIRGLCLTDRWEESSDLLDMISVSSEIRSGPLTLMIKTAFRRGKTDIGWKYMHLMSQKNLNILAEAYYSYLEYCLNTFKDKRELEINLLKMFEFLKETDIIIAGHILNDYLSALKDFGYTYTQTSISNSGRCLNCSHQLQAPVITIEEFEKMSKFFMETVFVGENVYYNTTPEEFKKFMVFLQKAKPYDIVIDGLNIAMCGREQNASVIKRAFRLSKVVEHFVNKNKKILLLGRQHMLKWKYMDYIRHNSKMFLVNNSSSDDVHLLYATLYGGMRTSFLSMDLMRQHKHKLPLNMQSLFKKWQLSHQYKMDITTEQVKTPTKFELVSQNDESGWHIPYHSGHTVGKDSYNVTTNWICLKKKKTSN